MRRAMSPSTRLRAALVSKRSLLRYQRPPLFAREPLAHVCVSVTGWCLRAYAVMSRMRLRLGDRLRVRRLQVRVLVEKLGIQCLHPIDLGRRQLTTGHFRLERIDGGDIRLGVGQLTPTDQLLKVVVPGEIRLESDFHPVV